jgi:hypothetical protein
VDKWQLPLFPDTPILDTEFTDSFMTSRMMRKGHAKCPVRDQAHRSPHPIPRSCLKCRGTGGAFNRGARRWGRWDWRVAGASRPLCRSRAGNHLAWTSPARIHGFSLLKLSRFLGPSSSAARASEVPCHRGCSCASIMKPSAGLSTLSDISHCCIRFPSWLQILTETPAFTRFVLIFISNDGTTVRQ